MIFTVTFQSVWQVLERLSERQKERAERIAMQLEKAHANREALARTEAQRLEAQHALATSRKARQQDSDGTAAQALTARLEQVIDPPLALYAGLKHIKLTLVHINISMATVSLHVGRKDTYAADASFTEQMPCCATSNMDICWGVLHLLNRLSPACRQPRSERRNWLQQQHVQVSRWHMPRQSLQP